MAATFVPFFEKVISGEAAPQQHQFNQYKLSKITLSQAQSAQPYFDRIELRSKLLSDLRNAVRLSLPDETVRRIQADVAQYRPKYAFEGEANGDPNGAVAEGAEKPSVELKKEGDKISQIVVGCVCGQSISLDCVY